MSVNYGLRPSFAFPQFPTARQDDVMNEMSGIASMATSTDEKDVPSPGSAVPGWCKPEDSLAASQ